MTTIPAGIYFPSRSYSSDNIAFSPFKFPWRNEEERFEVKDSFRPETCSFSSFIVFQNSHLYDTKSDLIIAFEMASVSEI